MKNGGIQNQSPRRSPHQSIDEWLSQHSLGGYTQAFADNGITVDLLGELNQDDLKEIGLTLGDRKRFLIAVRNSLEAPGTEVQGPGVQGSEAQGSEAQGSEAQGSEAQGSEAQGSATDRADTKNQTNKPAGSQSALSHSPPGTSPSAGLSAARSVAVNPSPVASPTVIDEQDVANRGGSAPEAERRQLTVMFVDLVGSTALAEQLDPEDMSQVVRDYQSLVGRFISANGGYISRYMGDGVLAYFGWPIANEDDATNAVNAALAITSGIDELTTPDGDPLSCRCGIATGLVVVGEVIGEGPSKEHAVVGETPNLAARLQGMASENSTVVSDTTRRLVGEHFEFQSLGFQDLKGIREPVPAYSVLNAKTNESRFQAFHQNLALPLVGRQRQLEQLRLNWQQATEGHTACVLLQGEPGIGKSRLLHAFIDSMQARVFERIILQCDPLHADSALYPAIQFIVRLAGINATDPQSVRLQKLRSVTESLPAIEVSGLSSDILPLLALLLGLNSAEQDCLGDFTGDQVRLLTLHALAFVMRSTIDPSSNTAVASTDTFIEEAKSGSTVPLSVTGSHRRGSNSAVPLLVVLEDAHWIDHTTIDLLDVLTHCESTDGLMLLVTARPEFESSDLPFEDLNTIQLPRLGAEACREVVSSVIAGQVLPDHIVDEIVERTDGVPLFAEELAKTVIESSALQGAVSGRVGPMVMQSLTIPSSLHDSLMSRLDRFQSPREVAQTASCIGREFSFELLLAISPADEAGLVDSLQTLVEAGLIFGDAQTSYSFKHALVRDTAYESLLKSKRQQIHSQIAEVLTKQFPELLTSQPELAGYHFRRGASYVEASRYWHLAAALALQRVSNQDAIAHASSGLECLELAGEEHVSPTRHYDLLFARGMGYMAVHGYAADTVSSDFGAALELAVAMNDNERFSQAARGVVTAHIVSSRFDAGLALVETMLQIAETDMQRFYALRMQGQIYLWQARFEDSRRSFEQAIELYDPSYQSPLSQWDDGVLCTGFLGITLTCLGQTDLGESKHRQSVEMANRLKQPFSQCQAMESWITSILLRGDDYTEQLVTFSQLADTHNMVFFQSCAQMYLGIQQIRNDAIGSGINVLTDGLVRYRACQSKLGVPKWMTYVAEGYQYAGQHDQALQMLNEAKVEMDDMGNEYFRVEWARVRAMSLLAGTSDTFPEAQALFEEAIGLSRAQGAHLFELTATVGFSRLQQLQRQHRQESGVGDMRQLARVVDRFSDQQLFGHLAVAKGLLQQQDPAVFAS